MDGGVMVKCLVPCRASFKGHKDLHPLIRLLQVDWLVVATHVYARLFQLEVQGSDIYGRRPGF